MVSITLPEKMSEEIDALISSGYYDNRSEIIREALRVLLARKPELRLVVAVELYKKGRATISRASEVAGIPYEDMKRILVDEGLIKRGARSVSDMKKKALKLQEMSP